MSKEFLACLSSCKKKYQSVIFIWLHRKGSDLDLESPTVCGSIDQHIWSCHSQWNEWNIESMGPNSQVQVKPGLSPDEAEKFVHTCMECQFSTSTLIVNDKIYVNI